MEKIIIINERGRTVRGLASVESNDNISEDITQKCCAKTSRIVRACVSLLVHFFAVVVLTATTNHQLCGNGIQDFSLFFITVDGVPSSFFIDK